MLHLMLRYITYILMCARNVIRNFEIEETKREIVKAEEELKLKLNELSYNFEPGIKSNAKDLSFEMKGVEKIK